MGLPKRHYFGMLAMLPARSGNGLSDTDDSQNLNQTKDFLGEQ